ncbi:hypothetical protein TIFTF001_034194 [Ficus carica]|uniref:Uncharacterized protein n=1 Tax=Ficus carica TaxID=3494 RepID=A0AA88DZH3_FICCA|nr:hypothetical protein TIFTF001_034194 [Ficus carica]
MMESPSSRRRLYCHLLRSDEATPQQSQDSVCEKSREKEEEGEGENGPIKTLLDLRRATTNFPRAEEISRSPMCGCRSPHTKTSPGFNDSVLVGHEQRRGCDDYGKQRGQKRKREEEPKRGREKGKIPITLKFRKP